MLPLRAPLAFSVKLWPACPPTESPVLVSGTVESVEAIVNQDVGIVLCFVDRFWRGMIENGDVRRKGSGCEGVS